MWQSAGARRLLLCPIAQIAGVTWPVEVEGVACQAGGIVGAGGLNIPGRVQKCQEVAFGCKATGDVFRLLPRSVAQAGVGLVILHLDLGGRVGVEHAAALRPEGQLQRLGVQVGLAFQVEPLRFAAATDVAGGGQGNRRLLDVGRKLVCARGAYLLPGGHDRGSGFGGRGQHGGEPAGLGSGSKQQAADHHQQQDRPRTTAQGASNSIIRRIDRWHRADLRLWIRMVGLWLWAWGRLSADARQRVGR